MASEALRVLCFGNPLHGDDGFGHAVWRRLAAGPLPEGVEVFEAGIRGFDAAPLFEDCARVIVVDALAPGPQPGRLHRLTAAEVPAEPVTGHGAGLGCLLAALGELLEAPPDVTVLAVETAAIRPFSPGLSPAVGAAVAATADAVLALAGRPAPEARRHG
ncbi:MAG: hydrogenase maturation protease [Rhodocyclaceae bacterium]|nr:hydrogenase maturation protease [Rhodocyclaceae bacterium]